VADLWSFQFDEVPRKVSSLNLLINVSNQKYEVSLVEKHVVDFITCTKTH